MEPLVRYIHNESEVLRIIISTNDDLFILNVYQLFLNYGLSLRQFFEFLLDEEFRLTSIDIILREDTIRTQLLSEFCKNYGGKFEFIVKEISKLATDARAHSSSRNLKKAVKSFVNFLQTNLNQIVSDPLVDICWAICTRVNAVQRDTGDRVVLSFLFLRILIPIIFEHANSQDEHLKILIQTVNRLIYGQHDQLHFRKSFIQQINDNLLNLVGNILRSHRPTDYWAINPLSPQDYYQVKQSFLTKMANYRTHEQNARKFGRSANWKKSYYGEMGDTLKRKSVPRKDPTPVVQSLENLITRAQVVKNFKSGTRDIRFIGLWTPENIVDLVINEKMDPQFFERWKINGLSFLRLDEETLISMGCSDIKTILQLVHEVRELAITDSKKISTRHLSKWGTDEICLWLGLVGMSELIPEFVERNIDGFQLIRMDWRDFEKFSAIKPEYVRKCIQFQKKYVNADPNKSFHTSSLMLSESTVLSLTDSDS